MGFLPAVDAHVTLEVVQPLDPLLANRTLDVHVLRIEALELFLHLK